MRWEGDETENGRREKHLQHINDSSKILSAKVVPAAFEDLNRTQVTSEPCWCRYTTSERVYSGTDTLSSERPDSENRSPTGNELDFMSPGPLSCPIILSSF